MKRRMICLLCALLALSALSSRAAFAEPFFTFNRHPLIGLYGLPASEGPAVTVKGAVALRLTSELSNTYWTAASARENLVLDMESLKLTLSARYGVAPRLEAGIDVPWMISGGGFLDAIIETYHDTFGFPNGGRELAPQNRLLAYYRRDGITRINTSSSGTGIGDVRLTGGWLWLEKTETRNFQLALRGSLKLPTGNTDSLFGSGSTDLALWLSAEQGLPIAYGQWRAFGEAGALIMTEGKILPDAQRPLAGFGSLGLGFGPAKWIDLKIQANAHTSLYSASDLKQINAASVQLTMGGTLIFSDRTALDIAVTEDVFVNTSPDVVLHLSLRHAF
ncbi:MAG: DUF3187 family protein [Smithellaceae bacterium]